jgi:hypothetical protein
MDFVALAVSLLALALAALTALKMRKLEFCPEVVGGDVILPRESRPGGRVRLLLPLHFSNAGHAGGVVEWVALRVTPEAQADHPVLFSPVAEVDMQRFIHARRCLSEDCIEPFIGFALDARRSLSKFVLFDVAERARTAPFSIGTGRHYFELFVKASNARAPKLERSFVHVLEQKHLDDHGDDLAVYLIDYQVTLPGARRALADAEWMPQATPAKNRGQTPIFSSGG